VGTAGDVQEFDTTGSYVETVSTTASGVYSLATASTGAVYAGTFDGNAYKWDSSGTEQWSNSYSQQVEGISVDAEAGAVYIGVATGSVYRVADSDGSQAWSASDFTDVATLALSPDGSTVFAGGSGTDTAVAYDAADGSQTWAYAGDNNVNDVELSPGGGLLYLGENNGALVALDSSSGAEQWDNIVSSSGIDAVASGGKFDFGPSTSISGTVTDPADTNLRGVSLTLTDASGTTVATTETNTNGDYSIPIGAGDYTLTADAPGYQPTTRSVSIDDSSETVDLTLREGFPRQVTLNDTADKFDDPRLVVFEYTAADIRQLEGGPYSQPDVWTVTDTYQFEDDQAEPNLVAGTQYAFRVVETGTGTTGGTAVVEEWPYYAQDDGRAVTIDVPGVAGNDTVSTRQTDAGTQVTYDGPPVQEFSYELPRGYNETLSFDEPREYYSTTVGANATNGTQSNGGELDYSGTYANGTKFNGSSIYDSAALSFGPTGGTGGGGGGASTAVAWGLIATAGLAAYARYGNGELGRALAQVPKLVRRVLP
jgi:hypothetical protein